jgi:hypothetical protein
VSSSSRPREDAWSNVGARIPCQALATCFSSSPLELARRAAILYPELFKPALGRLGKLQREDVQAIIDRVPADWMTPLARKFAIELMCYNHKELRKI